MRNQKFVSVVLSVTLSFLGVAAIAYGATVISTSITTGGTLEVTGATTLSTASTTGQVKMDNLVVGEVSAGATISAAGAVSASSTLKVAGLSSLTSLKVGASGSTLTKMVAGYCTIPTISPVASTTLNADCVPNTAGLIAAGDIVMVMATGSLPSNFSIVAASSSATNIINVKIANSNGDAGATTDTGINSFNFIAVTK